MPTKENQPGKASERATTTATATSALTLLEQDHREAEAYFDEYQTLKGDQEKEALALKICLALQVHAQIEEQLFYPAARVFVENAELIDVATVEHASAKQLITEIEAMEVGDQLRDAKVKVLGEQIWHHVQEEESELFPQLQDGKLDLDALGREMADLKQQLFTELAEGRGAL